MSTTADADTGVDSYAWTVAEHFTREDDLLTQARRHAESGARSGSNLRPATPATCSLLTMLAQIAQASAVVEVGTGTGLSGLALLRGMHPNGVLTTIDVAPEQHRIAREVFAGAQVSGRTRLISDYPLTVLPRLAEASYDMAFFDVLADASIQELPSYLDEAVRVLRPGALLVMDKAISASTDDDNDPNPHAQAVRELVEGLRDDQRVHCSLVPVGYGVLLARTLSSDPA